MEVPEVLFRVSMLVIPAVFSLVLTAFWFFYKSSMNAEKTRVDALSRDCKKLAEQYSNLQIELTELKAKTVTQTQVEDCIDKRFSQLEKEMLLRFDNLEKLILQIKQ